MALMINQDHLYCVILIALYNLKMERETRNNEFPFQNVQK